MRRLYPLALLLGCAAGGDPGDGGSALPDRGFGGYERLVDAEGGPLEPVARPDGVTLGGPMARVVDERVELYVTRCPDDGPCAIGRADGDGIAFGPLETVAEDPDGLSDPFAAEDGVYAIRGEGEGVVRIVDGSVRPLTLPAGVGPVRSPSVVDTDAGRYLYLAVGDPPALVRFPIDGDALGPAEPVTVGNTADWAPDGIIDPEVRRATSGANRTIYRLIYAGRPGGADADIAFAAAFDGRDFAPWPFNPALDGDPDELGASNIRLGDRYLIYFARRGGFVGVAERRAENPTEAF